MILKADKSPFIVSAAVRNACGDVYNLPPPNRHRDILNSIKYDDADLDDNPMEHGFLLNDGKFVCRTLGFRIAKRAGQILPGHAFGNRLTTEDLW